MQKSPYIKNRKKRNVEYIRKKNSIRWFKKLYYYTPFSGDITTDIQKQIIDQYKKHISNIKNIYKQDVVLISIENGYIEDDFLKNTFTVRFTFKKLKFNEEKPKLKISYIEH